LKLKEGKASFLPPVSPLHAKLPPQVANSRNSEMRCFTMQESTAQSSIV